MKSWITLVLLIVCCPFCAFTQKGNSKSKNAAFDRSPLYTQSWNLIELNGVSTQQAGAKPTYIAFKANDYSYNRISGFTGCNYLAGRVDLSGADEIAFHPDLITNNNCQGSTVETPFIDALIHVDHWSEKGGQLLLSFRGKVVARFTPADYSNDNLYGTWQLSYVRNKSLPFKELYPDTMRPTIVFAKGTNTISGFSGCYAFKCPVLINNNTMVFAENIERDTTYELQGETLFLSNLSNISAYGFKDDKTLVLIAQNEPVLAFTRCH